MNKKTIYKLSSLGAIGVIGGSGLLTFALISNKSGGQKISNSQRLTNYDVSGDEFTYIGNIFPTLSSNDLYKEVRVENGQAVMTDQLIAKAVNSIIKESKYINTDGLYWDYAYDNANEIRITFNWPVNGQYNMETYLIELYVDEFNNQQIANIEKPWVIIYNIHMNHKEYVIKKISALTSKAIDETTPLKDLGIDSLDLLEVITEVEEELSIEVSDEQITAFNTIGDIIKTLKELKK